MFVTRKERSDTLRVPEAIVANDNNDHSAKPGDFIKVRVNTAIAGEVFWVRVVHRGEIGYIGKINNDLALTGQHGLKSGDQVVVPFDCVLLILHA